MPYCFEALPGKERIDDLEFKEKIDSIVREAGRVVYIGWRPESGPDLFDWLMARGKPVLLVEAFQANADKMLHPGVERLHADVRDLLTVAGKQWWDCLIWQDGPEHLEMGQAVMLMKSLQREFDSIIMATPEGDYPQRDIDGNMWEMHRSSWQLEDYYALNFEAIRYEAGLIGFWQRKRHIE